MARKVHRIHSMKSDAPWEGGLPPEGSNEHPLVIRGIDALLAVQRPVVLAHLRSVRLRHPRATTAELIRILERRYLLAVTGGGAAVGATAVVPGIGTGVTLALSGVETAGFLESTALFAQSVAEVHGIRVADPDRARALVLTLMLGKEGTDLIAQLAGQAKGGGSARPKFWGEIITNSLPRAAMGPLADRLKKAFISQFAARGGASVIGKALPFGVGAVIGAGGNHILGRRVVTASRSAFGPPPTFVPEDLEPRVGARRLEERLATAAERATRAVGRTATETGRAIGRGAQRAVSGIGSRKKSADSSDATAPVPTPAADDLRTERTTAL